MKKTTLLLLNLILLLFYLTSTAQEYAVLGIASGFNADVIANGVGPVSGSTSQRVDNDQFNFHSLDFKALATSPAATVGLPENGFITAGNISGLTFQLNSYAQNNSLRMAAVNTSGTLVFVTPSKAMKMYLLATAGNAGNTPVSLTAKIKFSDNTFQTVTGLTVADWYQGAAANTVIAGIGRVNSTTNAIETPAANPKLFSVEITLSAENINKQIVNVEITKTSTDGVLNIFAVSRQVTPDCFSPGIVTLDDVLTTSVTIQWLAASVVPALGYEYEVRTSGLPGSGATGLASSGSVANTVLLKNVTGLVGTTEYFVYVRSKCSASSFSAWSAVKKFNTLCVFPELTTAGASVCGRGSVTLTASTPSGTIKWYDSAVGGTVVGTGTSFVTPILDASKPYWVTSTGTNTTQGRAGKLAPAANSTGSTFTEWGIVFNASQEVTIESVDVYSTSAGTLNVKVVNAAGVELFATGNINIINGGTTTPNVIPIDFPVQAANGYRILVKSSTGVNLIRDSATLNYPYSDEDGIVSVPASWWSPEVTSAYYYFYNLKYIKGCSSPRKMVTATVNPGPAFTLSATTISVCGGQPTEPVTITAGASSYDSYVWSPSTGVTGNAQDGWVFNSTQDQIYTLTASQTTGQRCVVLKKLDVKSRPFPTATYIPATDAPAACANSIVPLEVVYLGEKTTEVGQAVPTVFSNDLSAFNNFRASARVQMLFTAQELSALGVLAGPINSLAFNVTTLGTSAVNDGYTVRIAPTNLTAFTTANFINDGFITVLPGITYTHTASGWQEIVFDSAYEWDGVRNLIIEIYHQGSNSSASANTLHTVTTNNTVLSGFNDGAATLSKNRFNVKLKQILPYRVTWTAEGEGLFIDAAATVRYIPGGNVRKIYYRPQRDGLNVVTAKTTLGGCTVGKDFNVNTAGTVQPIVEAEQFFCGQPRVSNLVVEGTNVKWYTAPYGAAALAPTTAVEQRDYYVTQTINGCESLPKKVTVHFLPQPAPPVYTPRVYCGITYLNDLEVQYDTENDLKWYDAGNNLITSNIQMHSGVYYVAQSNSACESVRVRIDLSSNLVPGAPSATPLVTCGQARVSDLTAQIQTGAVANWYLNANSTTPLSSNDLLSTRTYYLSQSMGGCESVRVAVAVSVFASVPLPVAPNQNFCTTNVRISSLDVTTVPTATAQWFNVAVGGVPLSANETVTTGLYYVSQKIGDCESPRLRVGVNVVENSIAPNAATQYFCGQAVVSQLRVNVPVGMIAKWYTQETGGVVMTNDMQLQSGWYYVSQSLHGCESARKRVEVVISEIPQQPTGSSLQIFEGAGLVRDLVVSPSNVIWFSSLSDAENDRNRLEGNISLIDGNIYFGVAISTHGCLSRPFAVTVKIKTLGINDFDLKQLTYYPNPVSDVLSVSYSEIITKVEVYSLTGQLLFAIPASDYKVDVDMGNLAKANYMVKIYSNAKSQIIKVIKK